MPYRTPEKPPVYRERMRWPLRESSNYLLSMVGLWLAWSVASDLGAFENLKTTGEWTAPILLILYSVFAIIRGCWLLDHDR